MNVKIAVCALGIGVCVGLPAGAMPFPFLYVDSPENKILEPIVKDLDAARQASREEQARQGVQPNPADPRDRELVQRLLQKGLEPASQPSGPAPTTDGGAASPPAKGLCQGFPGLGRDLTDKQGYSAEALMRAGFDVRTIVGGMVGECSTGGVGDALLREIDGEDYALGQERGRLPDYVAFVVGSRASHLEGEFAWPQIEAGERNVGNGLLSPAPAEGDGLAVLRPIIDPAERAAVRDCVAFCQQKGGRLSEDENRNVIDACRRLVIEGKQLTRNYCNAALNPESGPAGARSKSLEPTPAPTPPITPQLVPILGGFYGDVPDPSLDPGAPASLQ